MSIRFTVPKIRNIFIWKKRSHIKSLRASYTKKRTSFRKFIPMEIEFTTLDTIGPLHSL